MIALGRSCTAVLSLWITANIHAFQLSTTASKIPKKSTVIPMTTASSLTKVNIRNLRTERKMTTEASPPVQLNEYVSVEDIEKWKFDIKEELLTSIEKIETNYRDNRVGKNLLSWKQTLGALSLALGKAAEASACVTLPSMTHLDASVRKASTNAKDELKLLFDEVFARPTLLEMLNDVSNSKEVIKDDDKHLISLLRSQFHRNGCHISNETRRQELLNKRTQIEQICSDFTSAINEHSDDTLLFSKEDLKGVDYSNFPTIEEGDDQGKIIVTLKAPFVLPILQFAKRETTRQRMATAMAKKCQEENTSRFVDVLKLRKECAVNILGYPSHAHFMLENKMACTPQRAQTFLQDLIDKIKPTWQQDELPQLLQLKQQEEIKKNKYKSLDKVVTKITMNTWDVPYYIREYKAQKLGVDEAKLKQYFPLEHVKQTILNIYQELLDLQFTKVEDAEVWHPDVECFAVTSSSSDGNDEKEIFGYFYFDIFPRNGKYAHQCVYPLRPAYKNDDENKHIKPACVNIGNLNRGGSSLDGKEPSLLSFKEVETFFHEFGHVMHCVLGKAQHSLQAWAWTAVPWPGGVEQDFLEVPSMMLENFVWQPEVLKRLSKHVDDESCLPNEIIESLSKSRFVMQGYMRCRYLAMALYDLIVHSPNPTILPDNNEKVKLYEYNGEKYDAISLYEAMMTDITGVSQIPDSFPVASWYHPMMGYDAGYYSYIWSETYAADLFNEFETALYGSIINPTLGKKYRDHILSPCAMTDGSSMLHAFLGREPSNQAFVNRITNNMCFLNDQKRI